MRLVGVVVVGVGLLSACGGKSTVGGTGSSGGGPGGDRGCTLLACDQGANLAFSYRDQGRYVVEVVVDQVVTTCSSTLPLPRAPSPACDRSNVVLSLVGSALPPDQQSIGGLVVRTTTAKRIEVRVARDGKPIARSVFDPVPWVSSPGPNGPGCEPATCTQASLRLADGAADLTAFTCGASECDALDYCEASAQAGGPTTYTCLSPAASGNGASSGGPLPTCAPDDCACIQERAQASRCTGGATCTLESGHAYVTCAHAD